MNAGAIPVSSDGCPKHSPGSSTWITSPSWTMSIDPLRTTHSPARRRSVLDQHVLAGLVVALHGRGGQFAHLIRVDSVERRLLG